MPGQRRVVSHGKDELDVVKKGQAMQIKHVKFMTGRVKTGRGSVQDKFRTARVSGQDKCKSEQSQSGLKRSRAIQHQCNAGPLARPGPVQER